MIIKIVTININPGTVPHTGHSVGGQAGVEAAIPGVNTRDVEMTDDLATWTEILPYHQPANNSLRREGKHLS